MDLPKTLLVATDFSETAEHALDFAVALANRLDARLCLLHVIGIPTLGIPEVGVAVTSSMIESTIQANQAELDKLAAGRPQARIETMLRTGDARHLIVEVAGQIGAGLIVMGTHGRRGLRRALIGSIAEAVLRTAPCPVLTLREA